MSSREPASTAPTGAPRPFVKSSQTVSKPPPNSAALVREATTAFISRAPSMCARRPCARATSSTCLHLVERPYASAAHVRGLLDGHDARARQVAVARVADRRLQLVRREDAAVAVERVDHQLRVLRRPARLGDDRVRGAVEDQLVAAGARVQPERDLVAHRPARQEQRRLLAEQLGHALLEAIGRGVGEPLLVGHVGRGDRPPHLLGGASLRVRVEVDHRAAEPTGAPGAAGDTARCAGRCTGTSCVRAAICAPLKIHPASCA